MTAAAFLSIALIHLMAAISPGPSFAVAVRTAAAEGFRPAARVFSLARARAAYAAAKAWVDRAFGALIAAFGLKLAAT